MRVDTSSLKDYAGLLGPLLILAAWFLLQLWILPSMGVST